MSKSRKNKAFSVSGMEPITTHRIISQKGGSETTVNIFGTDTELQKRLGPLPPSRPPRMMPDPRRKKDHPKE